MATVALSAAPAGRIAGNWTADFRGPGDQPKTVGSIILDLKVDDRAVSGLLPPQSANDRTATEAQGRERNSALAPKSSCIGRRRVALSAWIGRQQGYCGTRQQAWPDFHSQPLGDSHFRRSSGLLGRCTRSASACSSPCRSQYARIR